MDLFEQIKRRSGLTRSKARRNRILRRKRRFRAKSPRRRIAARRAARRISPAKRRKRAWKAKRTKKRLYGRALHNSLGINVARLIVERLKEGESASEVIAGLHNFLSSSVQEQLE